MPPPPLPAKAPLLSEDSTADDGDEYRRRAVAAYSKKRVGEGDIALDQTRLMKAIDEEKKRKAMRDEEDDRGVGKKRRGGGDDGSYEVTEEQMGMLSALRCFHND